MYLLNVCEFTTKKAIYILIVTLDSTHNGVKKKTFMKLHKTLVTKYVPVGKVMLNFCLSVS